jgi:hypothetical protein
MKQEKLWLINGQLYVAADSIESAIKTFDIEYSDLEIHEIKLIGRVVI